MHICQITSMHNWDDVRIFKRTCLHLTKQENKVSYIAADINLDQKIPNLYYYPINRRKGWKRRVFSSFQAYRIASKINADIYHFHDPDLIPWMYLLHRKGKKIIYDIHENFYEKFYTYPPLICKLLSLVYRTYELPLRSFSGLVTVSRSLRKLYIKKNSRCIVVMNVPPKKSIPKINSFNKPDYPVIYISGQHSTKRNCIQMVEALPEIKKIFPGVKLQLVGRFVPESFEKTLLKKATSLCVNDNLILEGMLPWEENLQRTTKATLGCVFYKDNPNNRVGIPNRLFEYMACGIPIIAEDFIELRRIINNSKCGYLVNSSNPTEIANVIIKLLHNPVKGMKMGARGRKAVMEKYNFEYELKKLITFYQRILSK